MTRSGRTERGASYWDILVVIGFLLLPIELLWFVLGLPLWLAALIGVPSAFALWFTVAWLSEIPVRRRNGRIDTSPCAGCGGSLAARDLNFQHPKYFVTCRTCGTHNWFTASGKRRILEPGDEGVYYQRVEWKDSPADEPIEMWSELDADRRELRKVDIFRDGSCGWTSGAESVGGTRLSEGAVPPLREIASDPEFVVWAIDPKDFDRIWASRASRMPHQ